MLSNLPVDPKVAVKKVRDHISQTEIRIQKLLEELRQEDAKSGCKQK